MIDSARSAAKADVRLRTILTSSRRKDRSFPHQHRYFRGMPLQSARSSAQFNEIEDVPCLALARRMDMRRFVYVLESVVEPDRHYVGLTADVVKRLRAHNDSRAIHTSKFAPWRLLVAIEFADVGCAARFEKFLKTGSGRAFARHHFR